MFYFRFEEMKGSSKFCVDVKGNKASCSRTVVFETSHLQIILSSFISDKSMDLFVSLFRTAFTHRILIPNNYHVLMCLTFYQTIGKAHKEGRNLR